MTQRQDFSRGTQEYLFHGAWTYVQTLKMRKKMKLKRRDSKATIMPLKIVYTLCRIAHYLPRKKKKQTMKP